MAIVDLTTMTAATSFAETDVLFMIADPSGSALRRKIEAGRLLSVGYGDISVAGGAGSQTPTAGVWTKLTQFTTNGISRNVTPDQASDKLILADAGDWMLGFSLSYTTASTAVDLSARIYCAGSTDIHAEATTTATAGDKRCIGATGFETVVAGSTDVELWVLVNAGSVEVKAARLWARRVW